jgi:hypothetical protein
VLRAGAGRAGHCETDVHTNVRRVVRLRGVDSYFCALVHMHGSLEGGLVRRERTSAAWAWGSTLHPPAARPGGKSEAWPGPTPNPHRPDSLELLGRTSRNFRLVAFSPSLLCPSHRALARTSSIAPASPIEPAPSARRLAIASCDSVAWYRRSRRMPALDGHPTASQRHRGRVQARQQEERPAPLCL